VVLALAMAGSVVGVAQVNPFESRSPFEARCRIDELVQKRHAALGLQPARVCSDAVFVRRAYLDTIGTLPTAVEAREFLQNPAPNKRATLIDRLLEREEYADYWAMKWSDLLRVKAEFPINLWPNAAQAYHRWIRTSLRENKPYDQFARELLTSSGSNFRVGPVNFYRAMPSREPEGIAKAVALTFLGMRAEGWPAERRRGMAVFFAAIGYKGTGEWKEEIVFHDLGMTNRPGGGVEPKVGRLPDDTVVELKAGEDPRQAFASWLIDARNPWFARCMVNRLWAWLVGRGIVHEPDDWRGDNPPVNPELLDYLAAELVTSHYDLKRVQRLILNSKTYQLAAVPVSAGPEAEANFAFYPVRRLEAEVLIDALNEVTGTAERYSSAIPEPFTYVPEGVRSIALPDGSITSSFLEMFGRPARDTGLAGERNNRPTAAQRLHLLNSSHIQRKLEQSRKLQALLQARPGVREAATGLYLTILSRYPTAAELAAIEGYGAAGQTRPREVFLDLAWALVNSAEFLHRH
jgi:hypothetical protein